MADPRATRLDRGVDPERDHVLGNPHAEMTLVEYGSYACPSCHVAHEVIAGLRDRFGDRLRYVFRHKPVADNEDAERAAMLAEIAGQQPAGATGERLPLVMASGVALPALICGVAASARLKSACTCPATSSASAGPPPL